MILLNQIPNKSLFKVQEVCDICQIKPYVLRFWDSEFDQIQSISNSSGKKLYQKKDILVVSVLKDLLFERKLTIEKARLELNEVNFDAIVASQAMLDIPSQNEKVSEQDLNLVDDKLSLNTDEDALVLNTGDNVLELNTGENKPDLMINNEKKIILDDASEQLRLVLSKIDDLKIRYNWA